MSEFGLFLRLTYPKNYTRQNIDWAYEVGMEVSHSDIIQAKQDLKDSKSCGLDGIYVEHLKHCSNLIIPLLSMCFTSLFVNAFLPEAMISGLLVPLLKTKVVGEGRLINTGSGRTPKIWQNIMASSCHNLIYQLLNRFSGNITANNN